MPLDAEKRAPDAEIAEAIADLDARVMDATVHGDASAPILAAAVAGIRAQRAMRDETKADVDKAVAEIGRLVREQPAAKSPLNADEFRRAVAQGIQVWGGHATRELGWRNIIIGSGLLVASLLIGGAIDRWALHPAQDISGMQCGDQPDRSRVCWIVVTPAPPAGQTTPRGRQ